MNREIKVVAGWSDYQVSNYGEVWSLKMREPKLMVQYAPPNRYCRVTFIMGSKQIVPQVHRLVWDAFGDEPFRDTIDHIDTNKLNNRIDNLQLLTMREHNIKSAIDKKGFIGTIRIPKGGLGYGVWTGQKYHGAYYTYEMAFEYLKTLPQNSHLKRDYSIDIIKSTDRPPTLRKLTDEQAEEIRVLCASGRGLTEIGSMYGISKYIVYNIKHGRSYV